MMTDKTKEKLIIEWKQIRGNFFNRFNEDKIKFNKAYCTHPLYDSVIKHFDKSFMEVNQIAESEISNFLENRELDVKILFQS